MQEVPPKRTWFLAFATLAACISVFTHVAYMSDRRFQVPFPIPREMACSPHFVQVHTASMACPLKFKSVPDREQASFICAKHQTDQPGQPGQCLTFVEICLKLPRDAFTNANLVVADIIQAIPSHVVRNHGHHGQTIKSSDSHCLRHEPFLPVRIAIPSLLNCPCRSFSHTSGSCKASLGKLFRLHCRVSQSISLQAALPEELLSVHL